MICGCLCSDAKKAGQTPVVRTNISKSHWDVRSVNGLTVSPKSRLRQFRRRLTMYRGLNEQVLGEPLQSLL